MSSAEAVRRTAEDLAREIWEPTRP
jgi:hypothetical protein